MPEISIKGMNCEHCKASVTKALLKVPGISNVDVNLAQAKASWEGNPKLEDIKAAIEDAGFDPA